MKALSPEFYPQNPTMESQKSKPATRNPKPDYVIARRPPKADDEAISNLQLKIENRKSEIN